MDRRLTSAAAGTTAFLACALWWWFPQATPVAPAPTDSAPLAQHRPRVVLPAPLLEVVPAPARVEIPHGPPSAREAALQLLAEYAGEGIVRCPVGDLVPDGVALGLSHAVVERGVLIGSVEDPEGDARIQSPGDAASDAPRAIVRWTNAWPGEEGRCEALVPELVPVEGWVLDAAGEAVAAGQVGNAVDGTWPIDADGGFLVECWRGTRCPLSARTGVGVAWGDFVPVVPDGPTFGVQLVLDVRPQQDLVAYLEEQVAESERLARMPDPLGLALRDPSLPGDARPLLEAWQAEEAAERAHAVTLLADLRAR